LAVLLVLLLSASTSFAAGFRLPEAGNKANAMGFAFTAQADNPSAIYYNPAGLTQLEKNNIALGVTYTNLPGGEFTGTTPLTNGATVSETQKDLDFFLPNMYYTYTSKGSGVAYGLGVFTPFGLGQEYENENTSIFRNQITKIDLKTIVINPTIAFDINEYLSVGIGVDFMYGMATLERTPVLNNVAPGVPIGNNPVNAYNTKLDGDGTAWGYNFGILLKPTKELRVGFNFRSPFTLEIEGADVDLSNISSTPIIPLSGATPQQVFGGSSYHTTGSTTIKMPATAALGVAYIWDRLTVEVDADRTFWSSYKSLDLNFKDNTALLPKSTSSPKNWRDVCALRTGLEYRVANPVALRAGFSYDPSPVPAETLGPELPDADRLYYMLGAGLKFGNWTVDIAGIYIDKKDRKVNNQGSNQVPTLGGSYPQYATGQNGTWTGHSWLAGMDIAYKF
jgi:long-chain fatty acid transport protein